MKTIDIPVSYFFDLMCIAHRSLNITNFEYGDPSFRAKLIDRIKDYLDNDYLDNGFPTTDHGGYAIKYDSSISSNTNKEI